LYREVVGYLNELQRNKAVLAVKAATLARVGVGWPVRALAYTGLELGQGISRDSGIAAERLAPLLGPYSEWSTEDVVAIAQLTAAAYMRRAVGDDSARLALLADWCNCDEAEADARFARHATEALGCSARSKVLARYIFDGFDAPAANSLQDYLNALALLRRAPPADGTRESLTRAVADAGLGLDDTMSAYRFVDYAFQSASLAMASKFGSIFELNRGRPMNARLLLSR
jgi:hypothetical protein